MLRSGKKTAALAAALLALGLAACGGDDESDDTNGAATEQTATTATAPQTATTETEPATDTETSGDEAEGGGAAAPGESPEDQPGGAGDEVPASSQALITGNGGRLRPATVHVPPFIAVRVQLRSADGVEYTLRGGGRTVAAGGEIETAGTTFDGLHSGERLVLSGPQGKVTIVADAEPGP